MPLLLKLNYLILSTFGNPLPPLKIYKNPYSNTADELLLNPWGIRGIFDDSGNLYVADARHTIHEFLGKEAKKRFHFNEHILKYDFYLWEKQNRLYLYVIEYRNPETVKYVEENKHFITFTNNKKVILRDSVRNR